MIVYGDVHGCLNELIALRKKIGIKKSDKEISVGDIVNKGPYSVETLHYMLQENILVVRGNHEDKFIRYHLHEQRDKKNPMKLTEEEKRIYQRFTKEDLEALSKLPFFIKEEDLTVVHGGILPSTRLFSLRKKDAAEVMRVRYLDSSGNFVHLERSDPRKHFWWSELYDGRYGYIVYGHQPFLRPRVDRFSFGIDTGAVYGNRLTAIVFEGSVHNYSFVWVPSKEYAKKGKPWILSDL